MQDSARRKLTLFPSLSIRGLLLLVTGSAVAAAVVAGTVQGNRYSMFVATALGLLGVVFAFYAVASLFLLAVGLVLGQRAWTPPGPFRPRKPETPVPRDLEGEAR